MVSVQRHASSPPPAAWSPRTCTCHHLAPLGGLCRQLVGDVYHLLLLLYGNLLFVLVVWAQSQARQHVLHAGGHRGAGGQSRRQNVELCNKRCFFLCFFFSVHWKLEFRAKFLSGGQHSDRKPGRSLAPLAVFSNMLQDRVRTQKRHVFSSNARESFKVRIVEVPLTFQLYNS